MELWSCTCSMAKHKLDCAATWSNVEAEGIGNHMKRKQDKTSVTEGSLLFELG